VGWLEEHGASNGMCVESEMKTKSTALMSECASRRNWAKKHEKLKTTTQCAACVVVMKRACSKTEVEAVV